LATPETVVEWQMRAWWSMLFVPKYETNLRSRYDCSLLCLELPTQNTASGPDSLRIARSLSPSSLIAWSHVIFWYLPLTSFIGDFSRCSPRPCSRIAAPFAQCAPRLSGESNTGSWRTHTPFSTTASIEQPTEQCVQTVRCTSRLTLALSSAACAFPIVPYGSWLANAPTPATMPERFRKARRSMVAIRTPMPRESRGAATQSVSVLRVSSMIPLLLLEVG
jgi:hypothetical protein